MWKVKIVKSNNIKENKTARVALNIFAILFVRKEIKTETCSFILKDTPLGNIWLILVPREFINGRVFPLFTTEW